MTIWIRYTYLYRGTVSMCVLNSLGVIHSPNIIQWLSLPWYSTLERSDHTNKYLGGSLVLAVLCVPQWSNVYQEIFYFGWHPFYYYVM